MLTLRYEARNLLPSARDQIVNQLKAIENELDIKLSIDYSLVNSDENSVWIQQSFHVDEVDKIGRLLQKLENIKLNDEDFDEEAEWYGCLPYYVPVHSAECTMDTQDIDMSSTNPLI